MLSRGFRIGRLFGIDIRVDWSWTLIFLLLTWNLVAVFARWHPGWSELETVIVAALASLIFFGCVLLHELAHTAVATSFGMRVRSITLFLFGGVSNIEQEPSTPAAEFLMAIVGPITSIVLGVAFLLWASFSTTVPILDADSAWTALAQLGPVGTLVAWLGPINLAIGVFNLIPGFPLDGGRVLRSILWKVTRNFAAATRWASIVGQAVGWFFIACGIAMAFGAVLPFFGTGLAGGLWLAFIGWFLHGAAVQSGARVALDEALTGMTVDQLMRRDGPAVEPETTVADLVRRHLVYGDDRAIPVTRAGALLGLVAYSDVRKVAPDDWPSTTVGAIMRPADQLWLATPVTSLIAAFERLAREDIEQLPVVDGSPERHLVGVLRRRDVTRWLELAWRPTADARRQPPLRPRISHG